MVGRWLSRCVLVDTAAHELVDVARERGVGESLALHVDDAPVVAHGRTGLGFTGTESMNFARGLVDERQEHVKRQFGMAADDVGCLIVAVIDEIAGPHGSQVEVATGFEAKRRDVGRQTLCHTCDNIGGVRV